MFRITSRFFLMYIIIFYHLHNVCAAQFSSPSNCDLVLIYQPLHTFLIPIPMLIGITILYYFYKGFHRFCMWDLLSLILWTVIIYISNLAIFLVTKFLLYLNNILVLYVPHVNFSFTSWCTFWLFLFLDCFLLK